MTKAAELRELGSNLTYDTGNDRLEVSGTLKSYGNANAGIDNVIAENANTGDGAYSQIHLKTGAENAYIFKNSANRETNGPVNSLNIWNNGSNQINLWTNSTRRITIAGDGNVGVGEINPTYKFVVKSDTITNLHKDAGTGHRTMLLGGDGDTVFQIHSDNSGTVGTGIVFTNMESSTDGRHWTIQHTANNDTYGTTNRLSFGYMTTNADAASNLMTGTQATESLTITPAGYVGINETTPSQPLHVSGTALFGGNILQNNGYSALTTTGSGAMTILGHNAIRNPNVNNSVVAPNTGYHSHFLRMYYNHGIAFHVSNATRTQDDVVYDFNTPSNTVSGAIEAMRISIGGNVGIGHDGVNPSYKLDVKHGNIVYRPSASTNINTGWYPANDADNDVRVIDYNTVYINKTKNQDGYSYPVWSPEEVGRNFDMTFMLQQGRTSSTNDFRHFGIIINGDGITDVLDRIILRHRYADSTGNAVRFDRPGGTDSLLQGVSIPDFADGEERQIHIEVREGTYINLWVDGALIHTMTATSRTRYRGKIGFTIYEDSGEEPWAIVKNLQVRNYNDDGRVLIGRVADSTPFSSLFSFRTVIESDDEAENALNLISNHDSSAELVTYKSNTSNNFGGTRLMFAGSTGRALEIKRNVTNGTGTDGTSSIILNVDGSAVFDTVSTPNYEGNVLTIKNTPNDTNRTRRIIDNINTSGNFYLGDQNWDHYVTDYGGSGTYAYSSTHRGMQMSGYSEIFLGGGLFPVDDDAEYEIEIRVKAITGDCLYYIGVDSFDANGDRTATDAASSYNYGITQGSDYVFEGQERTWIARFSGRNAVGGADMQKFDPLAGSFNPVILANYLQTSAVSVIKHIKVTRLISHYGSHNNPASSLKELAKTTNRNGTYYFYVDGSEEPYPAYCMFNSMGGFNWMAVGVVTDKNETRSGAAHKWSNFDAPQSTPWDDGTWFGDYDTTFSDDFKSRLWNTHGFKRWALTDQGSALRPLFYTADYGTTYENSAFTNLWSALSWAATGSDTSVNAYNGGRVGSIAVTSYGVDDPCDLGNKSRILLKYGEVDGVQDANRDRSMIASHAFDVSEGVDAPKGLGTFASGTSVGGTLYRDITPAANSADAPPTSISGAPLSYVIWITDH